MSELISEHDFLGDRPLKLVFNLLALSNPDEWEGWINYELCLLNGDVLVTRTNSGATIMHDEFLHLIHDLRSTDCEEFELMEPDFYMQLSTTGDDAECSLVITVDEGGRRQGSYSGSGIGFRLLIMQDDLLTFAGQLEESYAKLVGDKKPAS